jgi:hypothetical protein
MKDLVDAPVLRKGTYGYPKTHIVYKGNEFSSLYVQVGSKHYVSSTCSDPHLTPSEFEDMFLRKSPGKCLLCDTQLRSFEHYLCPFHYREYVNKDMYFKLDVKFGEVECLDAKYEHPYTCKDGHKVMSEAERLLDDYFFDNNIKHIYEPKIRIDGNTVTPDFCIFPNGEPVYIEYWGVLNDDEYETYKQDKLDLYRGSDITLINIYSTPLNELIQSCEEKLLSYIPGKINFEE